MPGIMALRLRANDDKPLKGAKVIGCTHINAQSAVCQLHNSPYLRPINIFHFFINYFIIF